MNESVIILQGLPLESLRVQNLNFKKTITYKGGNQI